MSVDAAELLTGKWLKRKIRSQCLFNLAFAGIVSVVAGVLLAVVSTFAFVGFFGIGLMAGLPPGSVRLLAAMGTAGFLVLLLIVTLKRDRERPELFRNSPRDISILFPGSKGRYGPVGMSITNPELNEDVLWGFFLHGPRLVLLVGALVRKCFQLARCDVAAMARIFRLLAGRSSRISFAQLAGLLPEYNPMVLFPQLELIEGVIFIAVAPSGVTLTQELRDEVRRVIAGARRPRVESVHEEPAPAVMVEAPMPDHVLLGVSPSATLAQIKSAYRRRIKECHPDRCAHLSSELRQLAEERAKALNGAYENLTAVADK